MPLVSLGDKEIVHKSSESDDLAGLGSEVGLDPAVYRTFEKARRFKQHSPNQDPPSITPLPAVCPAAAAERFEPLPAPSLTEPLKKLMQFTNWSRWAALDGILDRAGRESSNSYEQRRQRELSALSFSGVAGGVGTSSVVATLARLSAKRGSHVVAFDVSEGSLLPLFFGGRSSGVPIASFRYAGDSSAGMVHTFHPDETGGADAPETWLARCLNTLMTASDELIIDGGLIPASRFRHAALQNAEHVLVLIPDTRCLAALQRREESRTGKNSDTPLLLLNQFDPTDPLHVEIELRLGHRYPGRLIPVSIRRDRQVTAALAQGMTIIDYAPESSAAEDIVRLDQWFNSRREHPISPEFKEVQPL